MSGTSITIKGRAGSFSGYLATPDSGRGPGIVVIQEIFGVNAVIRGIADNLAGAGFTALCPDLFWRLEPDIELTDQNEQDWQQAFDLFGRFDVDGGVDDIADTISHLRSLDSCTGKVGAVGYCLGGLLAYLTACRTDINTSVGYYGVNIQNYLTEAVQIKNPLMLHIASKDEFVPPEAQAQIRAGLDKNTHTSIHVYEGQDHAFARQGGAHFDEAAAKLANNRTADFFNTHMR
ncbi:MAG: dienelactone hydrolase family protein [Parvularculales bacterium]